MATSNANKFSTVKYWTATKISLVYMDKHNYFMYSTYSFTYRKIKNLFNWSNRDFWLEFRRNSAWNFSKNSDVVSFSNRNSDKQREITLRDSLQKFITLHKARLDIFWCRMLVEIELLPGGDPTRSQVCPRILKRFRSTPTQLLHFWK